MLVLPTWLATDIGQSDGKTEGKIFVKNNVLWGLNKMAA